MLIKVQMENGSVLSETDQVEENLRFIFRLLS